MLETLDIEAELSKDEAKRALDALALRLAGLQREIHAGGIPVIIVFEGWQACGVGTAISRLLSPLDPRGYKVRMFNEPDIEESLRPPLWRFWLALPPRGGITVYDKSWYGHILGKKSKDESWYERVRVFERQLADDGAVIVKYWMHIAKKEQARRYRKLEENPALAWRVTKDDWRQNHRFDKVLARVERMLEETSTVNAPWTLVPAHDAHVANVCIAEALAATLENALARRRAGQRNKPVPMKAVPRRRSPLDNVDTTLVLDRATYEQELPQLQKELFRLENQLHPRRIPAVVLYEGWDAAGKGGNIKRLITGLDHRGFQVIPIAAPEGDEKNHHYLWRFWRALPKAGHITVFDRTWYGRVLVERVEGFATPGEWQRAYQEINEFEAELAAFGMVIVKFWLHISKDEQLKRFRLREKTPYKQWKITPDDWRNRKQWDAYYEAVSDMIERTSTQHAPWTVIEGNDKLHARVKALKTVIAAIRRAVDEAPA